MDYKIGDEWSDGIGNFIIVDVDIDRIRTFDYEGCIFWESEESWRDAIKDMNLRPVTEPLGDRIASWMEMHPETFASEYKGSVSTVPDPTDT